MNIITLFCRDDFFLAYEKWQTRHCLCVCIEVMTLIAFHQSGYRTFKHFYRHVPQFPHLVSGYKKEVLTLTVNVAVSPSLTRHGCEFATISAFHHIAS